MISKFPRVLVISYNSFLSTNANGRTLMNLFANWDSDCLAQLYMSNDYPDFDRCNKYYRVTDTDALKSLFFKKKDSGLVDVKEGNRVLESEFSKRAKTKRRNQFVRFIRNCIWKFSRWSNSYFEKWIDDFSPQIIILFSGNNAFIDQIAWKVSRKRNIPIVLYNCEDYYLKPKKWNGIFGATLRKHCDRVFEKTMNMVSGVIYNSDTLKKSYEKFFPKQRAITLYNPADDFFIGKEFSKIENSVAYLGNVGLGRDESLCDIADALSKYNIRLNVYGPLLGINAEKNIGNNTNIIYHGTVSYDECKRVMAETEILVHCESFNLGTEQFLKHAFSTKIADSLASGSCLFVYSPLHIALTDYLLSNKSAIVSSSREELDINLQKLLTDKTYKISFLNNAASVVKQNHISAIICKKFRDFILLNLEDNNV